MIDWPRVNELRDEVGAEDFDEVVDLFLDEVGTVIERLRDNPVLAQLEDDLHFLKGSAQSLGFSGFSLLCQDGERLSAGGDPDAVNIAAVIESFDRSKTMFVAELPSHIAG